MQGSKKIPIIDLNRHITCKICNGYFVDATTIIECLHTFCRSCIVKCLESNKYCPVCDVQVHKTKPLLNIRPDKTLQDVVYKLVPRLFQNEMQRRREFYDSHPETKPSSLEQCGEATYQHLLTPEETVCLTLSYHGANSKPRYLRCPAAVSLGHLEKLIRAKYDLTDSHRVEILFNQDCLNASLTLMDVAYIYLWKRKGPIELTYQIYDCTAKKPRLEPDPAAQTNNNNWKEVQLRISENGEMSITGIQDSALSPSLLEVVNSDAKYKNDVVTVVEAKSKKELPGLKFIGKGNVPSNESISPPTLKPSEVKVNDVDVTVTACTSPVLSTEPSATSTPPLQTICATLSSGSTTTVFSTINSTKCSTKTDDGPPTLKKDDPAPAEAAPVNNVQDKSLKRKSDKVAEEEPPVKQPKQTILNHSIGLLNLSNNHPLKKHSKLNRNGESKETSKEPEGAATFKIVPASPKTTSATILTMSKSSFVNKNFTSVPLSRPGTPITPTKASIMSTKSSIISPRQPTTTYSQAKSPCYMPKTSYNPVLNVPKPISSSKPAKNDVKPPVASIPVVKSTTSSSFTPNKQTNATSSQQLQQVVTLNSKMSIKSKPSTPIGYKTLRDPPKSWNSQISKANLNKPSPDPKYSDLKNVRPAKFFKMRNNMPRYLGNPASGVKPMYQVHVSPEKEKPQEGNKVEKSEIRKHSIVKIDPKTLKPISEKAPETTSLSNHSPPNQSDLKINTSSVSIFNPLKLQSSPKNERKSPKSPHSPKVKSQPSSSPTGSKREKVNLNFTPPNPFIPNLASPTLSPNQFLYPTGPPGFPTYDPRMMAAYHSLWYGQRMSFPTSPIAGLSLDLNPRKNFEMMPAPTSPKMGGSSQQGLGPQKSTKSGTSASSTISSASRTRSSQPAASKKAAKESKSEKSLESAVVKLTQSRNKEISGKGEAPDRAKPAERVGVSEEKENVDKAPPPPVKVKDEVISSEVSEKSASESVTVSTDSDTSVKKTPCIDRDKEATLGTNSVNSKNLSNNSTNNNNNNKNSEEVVERG